jgi:hypothetical protein
MIRFSVGAALVLTVACSNPTTPIEGEVAVRAVPPDLQVSNQTPTPVYSFIIERGAAAYTDWAPCNDPTRCTALAAGATTTLPYARIVGYTPAAREAIVYWWHLIPEGGAAVRPDSIRAVVTAL